MTCIALIAQFCSYLGSENIFSGLKHFWLLKISETLWSLRPIDHCCDLQRLLDKSPQSTKLPARVPGRKMSRSMFILLSNAISVGTQRELPLWFWYQGHCASPVVFVLWAHESQMWPGDPLPTGHQKAQRTSLPFGALNLFMDPPHNSYPNFLRASFLLIYFKCISPSFINDTYASLNPFWTRI